MIYLAKDFFFNFSFVLFVLPLFFFSSKIINAKSYGQGRIQKSGWGQRKI